MENLELKGTVILDKKSEKELREKIREEVVAEIVEKGLYGDEIVEWMTKCPLTQYVAIIRISLKKLFENTDVSKITWDSDVKALRILEAINSIFQISGR